MEGKVVELGEGKWREGEGCCEKRRAVMGDWEGRREGGERVVYWEMSLSMGRGRMDSAVLAWKAWGKGGGWRRVAVVLGRRGRPRWERKGGGCPSLAAASVTLTCDFFPRMCWKWAGWSSVGRSSSKGGDRTVKSHRQPKTRPHVYTHTFHSSSTATKIEEAGGSIPSFSS